MTTLCPQQAWSGLENGIAFDRVRTFRWFEIVELYISTLLWGKLRNSQQTIANRYSCHVVDDVPIDTSGAGISWIRIKDFLSLVSMIRGVKWLLKDFAHLITFECALTYEEPLSPPKRRPFLCRILTNLWSCRSWNLAAMTFPNTAVNIDAFRFRRYEKCDISVELCLPLLLVDIRSESLYSSQSRKIETSWHQFRIFISPAAANQTREPLYPQILL
jgi:hypothetical protein